LEVEDQTLVIKHLKETKADHALIQQSVNTLLALKKDLALAEVEELLSDTKPGHKGESDWQNSPYTGIDWSSIPVMHDVHEEKLRSEVTKLKYELELEKASHSRLKQTIKSKKLKAEQEKERKIQKKANLKHKPVDWKTKYESKQESYLEKKRKLALERARTSKLTKSNGFLNSDRYKSRIQKKGIKEFVHDKFKGKAQRNCLLSGKKRSITDKVDICEALVLRALGRKGYQHLRKNGPLFFPSSACLDKHIDKIMSIKQG
jgi:ribosomal protein S14